MAALKYLRNFSIVAHIDHGKSTLADRLIQFCGGLSFKVFTKENVEAMHVDSGGGINSKTQSVRATCKA